MPGQNILVTWQKNNLVMQSRCTEMSRKSGWVLNSKSKATSEYGSYIEWLPNLAQHYSFISSAQGLCEPWDCQHKHIPWCFGIFFPLCSYRTLFHYLQWIGMLSQAHRTVIMSSLLSLAILSVEIHCWIHFINWKLLFSQCPLSHLLQNRMVLWRLTGSWWGREWGGGWRGRLFMWINRYPQNQNRTENFCSF